MSETLDESPMSGSPQRGNDEVSSSESAGALALCNPQNGKPLLTMSCKCNGSGGDEAGIRQCCRQLHEYALLENFSNKKHPKSKERSKHDIFKSINDACQGEFWKRLCR